VSREIRFDAFDINCVAHQSPGLWRHPLDQSWRYKELGYWTDLAKLLERHLFDGLFVADVLGTYIPDLRVVVSRQVDSVWEERHGHLGDEASAVARHQYEGLPRGRGGRRNLDCADQEIYV
jgi:alkanesulfonate monooxygenase SsuD/methylene tetrahydromethanopterin reductase-like flavin-dependent oxidoreductase (luciferase family)